MSEWLSFFRDASLPSTVCYTENWDSSEIHAQVHLSQKSYVIELSSATCFIRGIESPGDLDLTSDSTADSTANSLTPKFFEKNLISA